MVFGYKQNNSNHTLFIKHQKGKVTILIVYVDGMIIVGGDPCEIKALQEYLFAEFEMEDLSNLNIFWELRLQDLLSETDMLTSKPAKTPIEMNHNLGIFPHQVPTCKDRYHRPVGKLIFFGTHTT
jgi:hypothetical protein